MLSSNVRPGAGLVVAGGASGEPRHPSTVKSTQIPKNADWRYSLSARLAVTDALVLIVTTAASVVLRFGVNSDVRAKGPIWISYPTVAAIIVVGWWVALALLRSRDPRLLGDGVEEFRRVVRATVMAFGTLAILSVLLKWDMSRGFLAITLPLGLAGLIASRKGWRIWLGRTRRNGRNISRVLVVGSPRAAESLARRFNGGYSSGMTVVGAWVPGRAPAEIAVLDADAPIPVLGHDQDIVTAISAVSADTVIVTDSEHLGPDGIRELTWEVEGIDINLMISPNVVDISVPRMHFGTVGGEPFIHVGQPQYAEAGKALKRLLDASLGAFLTLIALPILLVSAIAIKLTSPGPVFFHQSRVGRDGNPFNVLKLRTMTQGADQLLAELLEEQGRAASPLFKIDDDPRITRVGRFLRRYSIDELPQLLNVLKGEMSLVGPRPQRDLEVEMYDTRASRRLTVRPGMTGLWQVSGRSNLDWQQSVRLDLYYVENWSMVGDLIILWKTVRAVLGSDGAY